MVEQPRSDLNGSAIPPGAPMSRAARKNRRKGVSPRALAWMLIGLIVVAAVIVAVLVIPRDIDDGVELVGFSRESTETVSFAGAFPPADASPLANPLAIASDGERFYVAESDAGVIRVFTENGGDRGRLTIAPEAGVESAYPVDVAVVGEGRLAVVDTAGSRVVLLDPDTGVESPALSRVGAQDPGTAPVSPTAVAVVGGRLLVADAADGSIGRYDLDGRFVDRMDLGFDPAVGVVASLVGIGDDVIVSDSASGRVLVVDTSTGELVRVLDKLMDLPRGVAIGLEGRVFVADRFGPVVEVFDGDGQARETFGDGTRADATLVMPTDLAWHQDSSRLYVLDAAAGRVAVYNIRTAGDAMEAAGSGG